MSFFLQLRNLLNQKKLSSVELTTLCLKQIAHHNGKLNAFLEVSNEAALKSAAAADAEMAQRHHSPLWGIPLGIKDLIATKGVRTTAGSKILEDFVPPYDATVMQKLQTAGVSSLGKLNMDEFGMGSSNEYSAFGPVLNPWNHSKVPGGSSGGSAAAVAGGLCPITLGTDTGGSIRQPSSFCGLTGLKPTYGRVSRYGLLAYASSMDQIGPMGVDALSCAAVLNEISGFDPLDATSSKNPVGNYYQDSLQACKHNSVKGLRIGIVPEFLELLDNADTRNAMLNTQKHFENLGATFVEVVFKSFPYALSTYYMLSTSEASSNLSRYDGVHVGPQRLLKQNVHNLEELIVGMRSQGFGSEVKLRILLGAFALSSGYYDAHYKRAAQVRRWIKNEFEENFKHCDLMLTPCTPCAAFSFGEKTADPVSMYKSDIFTIPVNLAGLPALSFPVALNDESLPMGLQLIAPWWQESKLLAATTSFQNAHPESLLCANTWNAILGTE